MGGFIHWMARTYDANPSITECIVFAAYCATPLFVGGLAVHIGARVMAEAGSGEVLVSSTVKDLVAGSGLRFTGRGVRALRGVPGEWNLFAVA